MGLFSRLFKIGQAKANQVVGKFEKPEIMLDQALKDKEKALREAKEKVQNVIAEERKQKYLVNKEKEQIENWEDKAKLALQNNNEALAAKALTRGEEHKINADRLEQNWKVLHSQVGELKLMIKQSQDEIEELKRNKDLIIAQSKAAEVKKNIYQAKVKIGKDSSTEDLIARMRAKAEAENYRAEAAQEMAEDCSNKDSLEEEFEGLDNNISPSIQDRLNKLKEDMKK